MITNLEEFKVYQRAMALGETVWNLTKPWDNFTRYTVGIQLVKATDSIAANLSEGLGRYSVKETRQFGFYSRGSMFETRTWLQKAVNRGLIGHGSFSDMSNELDITGKMLNSYIKSLGSGF